MEVGSTWHHAHNKFYQAPPLFLCNVEKIREAGDKASDLIQWKELVLWSESWEQRSPRRLPMSTEHFVSEWDGWKKLISSAMELESHSCGNFSLKRGLVSNLWKDYKIFVQNELLSLAASQIRNCFYFWSQAYKLMLASFLRHQILVSGGDGLLYSSERGACIVDVT